MVDEIRIGNRSVLGIPVPSTDREGNLAIPNLMVPGMQPGIYPLIVEIGTGELRTVAAASFEVLEQGVAIPGDSVAAAVEPLGDSLVRIFRFDSSTKAWLFYDPRPAFANANTIEELVSGEVYWVNVARTTSVVLNGRTWDFTCVENNCWNHLVW